MLIRLFIDIPGHPYFPFSGEKNEGLSWGKSAVEMGLARMSAMGMFKPQEGTEEKKGQSFSNFNATIVPKVVTEKNETKTKKAFGFWGPVSPLSSLFRGPRPV